MDQNLILLTDSYKASHHLQYPPNTTKVYSYLESRGGRLERTLFFGLQYILKKYLMKPITLNDIGEASRYFLDHFGNAEIFNQDAWVKLLVKYNGLLPIKIKAVPEGTIVPNNNVLMTIENTDPEFYWLTNYIETLLMQVWYPITVASESHRAREVILFYLEETGDPSLIDYKLHDFGCRGVSSMESAAIGGAAHLVSFKGTDTLPSLKLLKEYYQCPMAGNSIPAAEHSTITSWGKENEVAAYRNMIQKFGNMEGIAAYAVVSDSYDINKTVEEIWGDTLNQSVKNAHNTLVIRPDSGDPVQTTLMCLEKLGRKFNKALNDKGYFVLHPNVRLIYGDGLDMVTIHTILREMKDAGWSADNIAFGMGGGLLQKVNRDNQKFAIKCSYVEVDGIGRDVFKSPVGDIGKISRAGMMSLFKDGNQFTTVPGIIKDDYMRTVFEDGKLLNTQTFDEIRRRAKGEIE